MLDLSYYKHDNNSMLDGAAYIAHWLCWGCTWSTRTALSNGVVVLHALAHFVFYKAVYKSEYFPLSISFLL